MHDNKATFTRLPSLAKDRVGSYARTKVTQYDGRRLVINQEVENKILIRIRIYDQADQLVENYAYERLNLGARGRAAYILGHHGPH